MATSKTTFGGDFKSQLMGLETTDGVSSRTLSGILGSVAHPALACLATYGCRKLSGGGDGIIAKAKKRGEAAAKSAVKE